MEAFLDDIFGWVEALPVGWIYATILIVSYLENVVPPIPGDMIIVFGGYLVGVGTLDFSLVTIISITGGTLGFMTMYAGGRWLGYAMLDSNRLKWLPRRHIFKAQEWLRRYGYGVVAANRFLSGTRSVISIAVGMSHMKTWKVCAYAAFSAGIWCVILVSLGFFVGDNWEIIGDYLTTYGHLILIIALLVAAFMIFRSVFRMRAKKKLRSTRND